MVPVTSITHRSADSMIKGQTQLRTAHTATALFEPAMTMLACVMSREWEMARRLFRTPACAWVTRACTSGRLSGRTALHTLTRQEWSAHGPCR